MPATVKPQKRAEIEAAKKLAASGSKAPGATISVWLDADFLREMPTAVGNLAIAQRIVRRLSTPKGLFPWWPNEGLNCAKYLLSKTASWIMKAEIEDEVLRDEQIEEVIATPRVIKSQAGDFIQIDLFIVTSEEAFDMVMTVSEAAANLIKLQEASL